MFVFFVSTFLQGATTLFRYNSEVFQSLLKKNTQKIIQKACTTSLPGLLSVHFMNEVASAMKYNGLVVV